MKELVESIAQALVLVGSAGNGEKYLCAYIVPVQDSSPGSEELKGFLGQSLPRHRMRGGESPEEKVCVGLCGVYRGVVTLLA